LPGATRVRESLTKVTTLGEVEAILDAADEHLARTESDRETAEGPLPAAAREFQPA